VFVLPASSPHKTMADVVAQFKKDPGSVKWGGGSAGSTEHIAIAMMAREVGVDPTKINYVPFRGGGEATAAILGGNVTVGGSGYSEFQPYIESGKMRAVGVTSATRQKGIDVATLKEQGINVEIGNWRGVYGAAGIDEAQKKALMAAAKKSEDYFEAESKKLDDKLVETFKANKTEVVFLNEAEFDAWRAVAQKTSYKNFAEKVPGGKELLDKALSVK
jgi:putative tricarboxylic transport membrane protein